MPVIPPGVQLLYTHNLTPYTQRLYSNTARGFEADPLLQPEPVAFEPHREWVRPQFQVDNKIK